MALFPNSLAAAAGVAWVLAAAPCAAQPRGPGFDWLPGETAGFLEGVCAQSRRCAAAPPRDRDSGRELVERLLELPPLTDGHSRRDRDTLARLEGNPEKQLDYALGRAVELMGKLPEARRWSRERRLEEIGEWLATDYDAGYWSTLPDLMTRYRKAVGSIGQGDEGVGLSFGIDIKESWSEGPTFLLDVAASVSNGPATHFRLWCDQCETISSSDDWHPWADWQPLLIVTGAGYKNICLQVRAEPYQGNLENMAIDCDAIGTPPSPEPPEEETVAPVNNPVQRCFGAIGNNCGAADEDGFDYGHCVRLNPITQPHTATCQINAGSWEHDECCIEKRVGGNAPAEEQGSCSPPMALANNEPYVCEAEFNKAVARLAQHMTWIREVDATIENTTGEVDFPSYCAPAGSVVHQDDTQYCCSKTAQPHVTNVLDALADLRRICL